MHFTAETPVPKNPIDSLLAGFNSLAISLFCLSKWLSKLLQAVHKESAWFYCVFDNF